MDTNAREKRGGDAEPDAGSAMDAGLDAGEAMESFREAVLDGHYEEARELFPDEWPEGARLLHVAAMLGHNDLVGQLVGDREFDLNCQDDSGWTPLMHALVGSHCDTTQLLIKTGKCDLTIIDSYQQTCLHLLAQSQITSTKLVEFFLAQRVLLDAEDKEGTTPFLRAVESHNAALAQYFYKKGCHIHACNLAGMHALHFAVFQLHEDLVKWLLSIGCKVDCPNNFFQTPLMLCAQSRSQPAKVFHIMRYLVNNGSQVNVQDCHGNTTLLLALSNPAVIKKQHIELLLSAGANPNIPNRQGLTPIWQAVYDGLHYPDRIKVIQLLLFQNCYMDMSCRGKLLFTSGSDAVYCYENFLSPLEVALDSGFQQAAKMLVHAGCQVRPYLRYDIKASEFPAELGWFQNILENPPSLKHKSRLVIRRVLGETIQKKAKQLPLPEILKHYVLLQDILDLDV